MTPRPGCRRRKAFRCAYVARQIAVKQRYGLWVTRRSMTPWRGCSPRCPGQAVAQWSGPIALGGGRETSVADTPASSPKIRSRPPIPSPRRPVPPTPGSAPVARPTPQAMALYWRGTDREYDWYQDRDHDGRRLRAVRELGGCDARACRRQGRRGRRCGRRRHDRQGREVSTTAPRSQTCADQRADAVGHQHGQHAAATLRRTARRTGAWPSRALTQPVSGQGDHHGREGHPHPSGRPGQQDRQQRQQRAHG